MTHEKTTLLFVHRDTGITLSNEVPLNNSRSKQARQHVAHIDSVNFNPIISSTYPLPRHNCFET